MIYSHQNQAIKPYIIVINNEIKTTSLKVAEHFGKNHKDVLRAIENLECSEGFRRRNFAPTSYEVKQPNGGFRLSPAYEITRDGFTFLAMGFTGREAAQWKEAYINAFNAMEAELRSQMSIETDYEPTYPPGQPNYLPPFQRINANLLAHLDRRSKEMGDAYLMECGVSRKYINNMGSRSVPQAIGYTPYQYGENLTQDIEKFIKEWAEVDAKRLPFQFPQCTGCLASQVVRLFRYWLSVNNCHPYVYPQREILMALCNHRSVLLTYNPRIIAKNMYLDLKTAIFLPPGFYGADDLLGLGMKLIRWYKLESSIAYIESALAGLGI